MSHLPRLGDIFSLNHVARADSEPLSTLYLLQKFGGCFVQDVVWFLFQLLNLQPAVRRIRVLMPRLLLHKEGHDEIVVSLQLPNHSTSIATVLNFQDTLDLSFDTNLLQLLRKHMAML